MALLSLKYFLRPVELIRSGCISHPSAIPFWEIPCTEEKEDLERSTILF
jgi:hypothetical protein